MKAPSPGTGWPMRLALILVAGAGLALVWVVAGVGLARVTPLDRYDILDIVTDGSLRRHAVVIRHASAGVSHTLTGVWIVDGDPPDRDSRTRPPGPPAAVWREGIVRLGWQAGRLRLIGDQTRVHAAPQCDPDAGPPTGPPASWQLCHDPERARFTPFPR